MGFCPGHPGYRAGPDIAGDHRPARADSNACHSRIYVEQMQFKDDKDLSIELSGALVITRDTKQPVAQLLYLPSLPSAWMTFENRVDMESWLFEHQPQMFDQPRLPTGTLRVYYTELERSVLQTSAESLWARLPVTPADRPRNELILALPATLPDADTNEDDVLFGQLSPDIPLGIRRQALEQQRTALDALLGENFQGDHTDPRLQRLQQQMDALTATEQASTTAATALLNTDSALKMLELRHTNRPHYIALYQARLDGLRAEAELQLSLNQISTEEHQWLTRCWMPPIKPRGRCGGRTADAVGDGHRRRTTALKPRNWMASCCLSSPRRCCRTRPTACCSTGPGASVVCSVSPLDRHWNRPCSNCPANDKTLALHVLPLSGTPFEYALQTQLHSCEQQAARLMATNPVPSHASQRAAELEKLREQTLARLTVPQSAAAGTGLRANPRAKPQQCRWPAQLPSWHRRHCPP